MAFLNSSKDPINLAPVRIKDDEKLESNKQINKQEEKYFLKKRKEASNMKRNCEKMPKQTCNRLYKVSIAGPRVLRSGHSNSFLSLSSC